MLYLVLSPIGMHAFSGQGSYLVNFLKHRTEPGLGYNKLPSKVWQWTE